MAPPETLTRSAAEGFPQGECCIEEAPVRIELTNSRFAVCRLTTWPRRRANKVIGSSVPRAIVPQRYLAPIQRQRSGPRRSEERRVGKECRSSGSPEHSKKKVVTDCVHLLN